MSDGDADGFNINETWQLLVRLRQAIAEIKEINEKGWKFLSTARYQAPSFDQVAAEPFDLKASSPDLQDRVAQIRGFAERVADPKVKQALIESAEIYERLGENN